MFCAYCGKKIDDHSGFCPFCGNPVSEEKIGDGKQEAPKADGAARNIAETIGSAVRNTMNKKAAGFFTKNQYKNTKILIVIVLVLAVLTGILKQIGKPGSEVRNSYLSQYSNAVTVGEAFDDFFDKGKWSDYKEGDYSYVVFTGVCEFLEERVDVRVLFKITGENFIVDRLEINGQTQNDLMLYSLLLAVYEDY